MSTRFSDGWICRTCWGQNKGNEQVCYRCKTPRDPTQTAEDAPPEKLGTPTAGRTVVAHESRLATAQIVSDPAESGTTDPPGAIYCPQCGARRAGTFRYCPGCRFDFDAPLAVQTQRDRAELILGSNASGSRAGLRRPLVVLGVIALLGLGAGLAVAFGPGRLGTGLFAATATPTPRPSPTPIPTLSPTAIPIVTPIETPMATQRPVAWWPEGYNEWLLDQNVAWRWQATSEFRCTYSGIDGRCFGIEVVTRDGCPDSLYVELSLIDANGAAIGFTNDTAGAILPGQHAKLVLDTFEMSAVQGRVTQITCY